MIDITDHRPSLAHGGHLEGNSLKEGPLRGEYTLAVRMAKIYCTKRTICNSIYTLAYCYIISISNVYTLQHTKSTKPFVPTTIYLESQPQRQGEEQKADSLLSHAKLPIGKPAYPFLPTSLLFHIILFF
jgi:hypothetical protein